MVITVTSSVRAYQRQRYFIEEFRDRLREHALTVTFKKNRPPKGIFRKSCPSCLARLCRPFRFALTHYEPIGAASCEAHYRYYKCPCGYEYTATR